MDVMNRTHRMLWAAGAKKVLDIQPSSSAVEHFSIPNTTWLWKSPAEFVVEASKMLGYNSHDKTP